MALHPSITRITFPRAKWLLPALGVILAIAGCSSDNNPVKKVTTYEVKGQVLLPDGKPLSSGMIYFQPKTESAQPAQGRLGSDGTFTLTTGSSGPGAAAGDYKVYIEADPASLPKATGKPGATTGQVKLPFHADYSDPDTSGLVATVKPETNQLPPFRLDASGPKTAAKAQPSTNRN